MRWSSLTGKKKRKVPPKCPDCRNRRHNKEVKPKVWRCACCRRIFVHDPSAKPEERKPERPKQIGVDVEDADYEDY